MNRLLGLVVLLALLPSRASPLGWSGSLSSGYWRSDSTSSTGTVTAPAWDFGGNLQVADLPFNPRFLNGGFGVDYRQSRDLYSESRSRTDNLGYNGNASLFSSEPINLSLFASRVRSDFSSDVGATLTGSTLTTSYGASSAVRMQGLPSLRFGVNRLELENSGFFGASANSGATSLFAGASDTVGPHSYGLEYSTDRATGDFVDANFRTHNLTFSSTSRFTKDLELGLSERFYRRTPLESGPTNALLESNSLGANLRWTADERTRWSGNYFYSRAVAELVAAEPRDNLSHAVSAGLNRRISDTVSLLGSGGATYIDQRLGPERTQGTAEQVGGGARWQRTVARSTYSLEGVGNVGLQQLGRGNQLGYGASASANANRTGRTWTYGGGYTASYDQNLGAVVGWSVRQVLTCNAERPLGRARFRAAASASGQRRDSELFGSSFSRSLGATASLIWRRFDASLVVGLSDDASNTAGGFSEGFLLPAEFTSHSRHVTGTTNTRLSRTLSLSTLARYMQIDLPSRPLQHETALGGTLTYTLGLFSFSAEDRYTTGGVDGLSRSGNLFIVRASRSFGGGL